MSLAPAVKPSADDAGDYKDSPQLLDEQAPGSNSDTDTKVIASEFLHLSRWQTTKTFWRATLCCFFGGVCVLMEGYQGSITGSIVSNVGFIDQFGTYNPATGKKSLAAEYVSAWGGTGVLAEQFVTTMAGWLGAKMVAGLAGGMGQATSLLYISEVAPVQNRGALLCCYGLFLALGQLSSAIALEVVNVTNPHHWRLAIYSEWVLVGLFLVCLPFIVESPWYYARKGLEDQAKAALKKLNGSVDGYNVEHEYLVMATELEHEQAQRRNIAASTYREIFMGTNFKRTMASFFGVIMLQWSGASVVFSYATYFLQQAGIKQPFQATCIVYSLLVAMVIVSFYTTEKFGRRTLIFTGGTGCFVCNIILGALGTQERTDTNLNATLAVICIWVLFYAGCLAGVGWGLTSEISTPRLRARTTGVVISMSMCFSLMFGYTVPLMLASTGKGARGWGVKTMFLFACLGGIGLVVNFFILPEVGGRTFSEVDEMYESRVPPRKMKGYVAAAKKAGKGEGA
ncbi:MFS transporter fmqE [Vanrija pseudolonga]|uniref:MFS transporter fmqE n=1 Tax=Vanrija pseudolonga TaxID=143232 RepID=A0AAF0Y7W6_9TREE|nr:MFS transporter fmqE [Vanrija pseudolonga]